MPQRLGAPKELRLLIRSYLFLHTKVLLMQGLVSDGGRSLVTRILSTRPLLFLGNSCHNPSLTLTRRESQNP